MCSTAPPRDRIMNFTHATEVITELRAQIEELSDFAKATVPRVEAAATHADLEALAGKTSRMLAALALAIVELKNRPTRRQRVADWLHAHVYDGTPIFTQHTERDDRRW